jgi:DNA (cytosine-5)-methyltransferase 1
MKHLGDITKIHGDQIEPVDCITFGSPCQGLSMAGKRLGFDDDRSVLFLDAARIIKEMRIGSLFDGLGGFPLVWQRAYGEGTARWASEIEEFPMAVTKRRFGEE